MKCFELNYARYFGMCIIAFVLLCKQSLIVGTFNEVTHWTFKSIFHKILNSFKFKCEITLESVHGTNQYYATARI